MNKQPDPHEIYPIKGCHTVTQVKPTITKPNILVGDFTYFSDVDFEKHVLHHYEFIGDKLIIGRFLPDSNRGYIHYERGESSDERRINISILRYGMGTNTSPIGRPADKR